MQRMITLAGLCALGLVMAGPAGPAMAQNQGVGAQTIDSRKDKTKKANEVLIGHALSMAIESSDLFIAAQQRRDGGAVAAELATRADLAQKVQQGTIGTGSRTAGSGFPAVVDSGSGSTTI